MNNPETAVGRLASAVHRYLIWLVIGSYALAAVWPAPGLSMRQTTVATIHLIDGETARVSLPMLMLAFLLWNAGMGVQADRLRGLGRVVLVLLTGVLANLLVPLTFTAVTSQALRWWHDPAEAQAILVGLALIAAMPIAGSSTAWSQHTNGDMALSLGLVLATTLLSPITTPLIFAATSVLADGDSATDLRGLAAGGTGMFLIGCVVIPSLIGVCCRWALDDAKARAVKPYLSLANTAILLLLIYSNTALALPDAIAYPDYDFLALVIGVTACLCGIAFVGGWWIGRLWHTDRAGQSALMFGLGMNNNGTGLVLASMTLANQPRVMLPIIVYNLVQHLVAGAVAQYRGRSQPDQPGPSHEPDDVAAPLASPRWVSDVARESGSHP